MASTVYMLDSDFFIQKLLGYKDINCIPAEKMAVCTAGERETSQARGKSLHLGAGKELQ